MRCELCPLGYRTQNGKCKNCHCDPAVSFGTCSKKGRCNCLPRYGGKKCQKCANGFENFPDCTPVDDKIECLCDARTSWSICPLNEGDGCQCLSTKYTGEFCGKCATGRHLFPECELIASTIINTDIKMRV